MRPVKLRKNLEESINAHTAVIGVVGLGYVGLPMLVAAQNHGMPVVGFDKDHVKLDLLRQGKSYIEDVDTIPTENTKFAMTPLPHAWVDVWVIAVPTPLKDGHADLQYIRSASESIGAALKPGSLVCLESSTYPGTTEEVVRPILEDKSGLVAGKDFALVYSPERIDPGSGIHVEEIPKLVAGLTEECADLGELFYRQFVKQVVRVSSLASAEMAKLIENTFRQVNIALVNQLATLAPELGVDVWEAIRAASTKPFGYMPFWPGPGVGGHCIGVDAMFLADRARQKIGTSISLIEAANEVNASMPAYVVAKSINALNDAGRAVSRSNILLLGLAYKPNIGDLRESPALQIFDQLNRLGARVVYHDSYVPEYAGVSSVPLTAELLQSVDLVLLLTNHTAVDYDLVSKHASRVIDTRAVLPKKENIQWL